MEALPRTDIISPLLGNRTVLMTGGSSGIGNQIAVALCRTGANVAILSRNAPDTWEIPVPAEKMTWLQADLLDTPTVQTTVAGWLAGVQGQVDAFIHSAGSYGYGSRHPLWETTLAEWDEIQAVNTRAPVAILHQILPFLQKRPKALLLNISSLVVYNPAPGRVAYAASKSALHAIFAGLAEELKHSNIHVVELLPRNAIVTPGIRKRRPDGFDFFGYDEPSIFAVPIVSLIQSLGDGYQGQCFLIDEKGLEKFSLDFTKI